MRWLGADRGAAARLAVTAAVVAALVATHTTARGDGDREARLDAVAKTEGLLDDALAERETRVRTRVRALYKLARAGDTPLWLDVDARRERVRWRGAARRILRRELRELALFREERRVAGRARHRLERSRVGPGPAAGSLLPPVSGRIVAGAGPYRHRASKATLVRRGVLLASAPGAAVVAAAAGKVVYAGPLRGLDRAVVVDHGGYHTVVGQLASVDVSAGDSCRAGGVLGQAGGDRVYFEVRLAGTAGGSPVDPAPLLRR